MAIGLAQDTPVFEFPEVHADAVLHVTFQRTLRVPDDGRDHHLPPGLGSFPLRAVDELPDARVPADWRRRGGVVLPMWQAEACWLSFSSPQGYPMALKIAAGKVNAINGKPWTDGLDFTDQDYVEVPGQPWLDGFCVSKGTVRQFVAMPLGEGYTAEEQTTGAAEYGGIQLLASPLKREVWEKRLERQREMRANWLASGVFAEACASPTSSMGLAPGGSIQQHICKAVEGPTDWHLECRSRCSVHIANSASWRGATGKAPPSWPPKAADYTRAGLPWFAWYDDRQALEGSAKLARLKSVRALGEWRGETPLPENEGFEPPEPVVLRSRLVGA
jgi:hypothetical protein